MQGNNSLLVVYVRDAYMRACNHFADLIKWLFEPLGRFRSWREDEKYTKINKIVLSLHFYAHLHKFLIFLPKYLHISKKSCNFAAQNDCCPLP